MSVVNGDDDLITTRGSGNHVNREEAGVCGNLWELGVALR